MQTILASTRTATVSALDPRVIRMRDQTRLPSPLSVRQRPRPVSRSRWRQIARTQSHKRPSKHLHPSRKSSMSSFHRARRIQARTLTRVNDVTLGVNSIPTSVHPTSIPQPVPNARRGVSQHNRHRTVPIGPSVRRARHPDSGNVQDAEPLARSGTGVHTLSQATEKVLLITLDVGSTSLSMSTSSIRVLRG